MHVSPKLAALKKMRGFDNRWEAGLWYPLLIMRDLFM